mgnify:CR=1 FL=1
MIIGPHAVTSMLITIWLERCRLRSSYKNKLVWLSLIATLSLGSHFFLDSIPHYDYTLNLDNHMDTYKLAADALSAGIAFLLIFWHRIRTIVAPLRDSIREHESILPKESRLNLAQFVTIWLGIFFACLPDILNRLLYPTSNFFIKNLKKVHDFSHVSEKADILIGCYIQVVIYLVIIFLARYLAKKNFIEQVGEIASKEYAQLFTVK